MGCKKLTYRDFTILEVVHQKNATDLQKKHVGEGYVEPNGNSWQYTYQYRDIWGNERLAYSDLDGDGTIDPSTEIKSEKSYYPFGLLHKGYNNTVIGTENNYKQYQGQEYTEDLGLNTHEWKYRMSDPAIGRFWQIDPLAEDYVYNSTYAFQENKMGMGVELEGLELAGWDIAMYVAEKASSFMANTSTARSQVGSAIGNQIMSSATGVESNPSNSGIAGATVSQVQDVSALGSGLGTISTEAGNTAKQVIRDGADAAEVTGDTMVATAPLTGPAAPVMVVVGETLSTVGTATNITMDVVEGDYRSAGKRAVIEVMSGGLSTFAKNAPGVDETAGQIIDSHIIFYENVVIPKVEEKIEENNQQK